MELLFDYLSQPVGWQDGSTVFSRDDGCPRAFIDRGGVFSAENGCYLGQVDHGIFRDRLGYIVAFPRHVWWSRVPASFQSPWKPPVQVDAVPSRLGRDTHPDCSALPSLRQSNLTWERYLLGCEAKPLGKTRR